MKPVRVEPEADHELAEAINYYEGERNGLGGEFWAAIRETLDRVQKSPDSYALLYGVPKDVPARAAFVDRFPYKIVYFDLPEVVHVLAFAHMKREPLYWEDRR